MIQICKTWLQPPWVKKTGPMVSSAGNLFLDLPSPATLSWEALGCKPHLCAMLTAAGEREHCPVSLSPRSGCRAGSKARELFLSVLEREEREGFGYCWQCRAGLLLCTQAWVFLLLPLEQPWACSRSPLHLDFFQSNSTFHQKAEIFSTANETTSRGNHRVGGSEMLFSQPEMGVFSAALAEKGRRDPPAPPSWLLRRSKPRTSSEATESKAGSTGAAASRKTQLGLGKRETIKTAKGTWQPFDSKQKCAVTFIVKERHFSEIGQQGNHLVCC